MQLLHPKKERNSYKFRFLAGIVRYQAVGMGQQGVMHDIDHNHFVTNAMGIKGEFSLV